MGAIQNHYGWIETSNSSYARNWASLFQNHYGWIETFGYQERWSEYK